MAGMLANLPKISPAAKTVSVLAVSPDPEDHACLRAIFRHSNWKIFSVNDREQAMGFLDTHRTGVVVCERDLPDGCWKNLLESLSELPVAPMLVVTSRNADDDLWSEVLNLGAYDVLSKPFDRAEVTRIISLAWLHWKDQSSRIQKPVTRALAAGVSGGVSATA